MLGIQPVLDDGTPRKGRSFFDRLSRPVGSLWAGFSLYALIGLCLLAYWPGLAGPFLFDDFANLSALGEFGGIDSWHNLLRYLKNGLAGPTGRPISLLSFLLNDQSWPSQPWSFKYTNLLIHAINGLVLFWCCLKIYRINTLSFINTNAEWLALVCTSLWLLHPLHVSTTLYVVQRMAMLSALFSLCGILLYLYGREIMQSNLRKGYAFMFVAVTLFTILAVLSKENGALLPALLGVLEFTVLRNQSILDRQPARLWSMLFLVAPALAAVVYLARMLLPEYAGAFAHREFTAIERGLTESRILLDYIYHLAIPKLYTGSLYNDDYNFSTSLLTPPTTLLSLTGIIALLILGYKSRKSYPLVGLALLFFFVGHLLESTVASLDLYYEHRNYLPSVFLFMPLAYAFVSYRKIMTYAFFGLIILMSGFTAAKAKLWSSEPELLLYWGVEHPDSVRAQRNAANAYFKLGMHSKALGVLAAATEKHPKNFKLRLHRMVLSCYSNISDIVYFNKSLELMRTSSLYFDSEIFDMLDQLVSLTGQSKCPGVTLNQLNQMAEALLANPSIKDAAINQCLLAHVQGAIATQQGDGILAMRHFAKALELSGNPETGMLEVSLLASHSLYSEALQHLKVIENILPYSSRPVTGILARHDYPAEIERLRKNIHEDMAHSAPASNSSRTH